VVLPLLIYLESFGTKSIYSLIHIKKNSMGPLVNNLFSAEFNYLIALAIGIAFGIVLEQAGFSTSKKLAGLFYGTDFVVLRVFFTAAITAAIGIVLLERFGFLNLSLVFIPTTFLWPIIIGGIIMGLGFIIGGFCPGTSVCAASIGKIDAIVFVAGLFFGIIVFAETYSYFEDFYYSSNLGEIFIYDSLGISRGLFIFLITIIAIVAFVITWKIEQKKKGVSIKLNKQLLKDYPKHKYVIVASLLIGFLIIFVPTRKEAIIDNAADATIENIKVNYINSFELAYKIINMDKSIQIIDIQDTASFRKFHLPQAVNIPISDFTEMYSKNTFKKSELEKIIITNSSTEIAQVAQVCKTLGYKNIRILKGGISEFKNTILLTKSYTHLNKDEVDFVKKAQIEIPRLIKEANNKVVVPIKTTKRVKGGC